MAELTDEKILAALYAGGVNDWAWFDESVSGLSGAAMKDASAVMDALRTGGVDNWEGYDFAMEALDFEDAEGDEDEEQAEEPAPIEDAPPMLESERRLRAHLGDSYEEQKGQFWSRKSNPKLMDRLIKKILRPGGGTLEDVRLAYLDEITGKA